MYTVADYLLDRLKELGITEIFGVPGDYNLKFLDRITAREDFKWIGNANELNAAYMADGYARTKGISAFVTTFGVGELSAINGLAGSYAENVPVIEIVGSPTTKIQNEKKLVHHTLGDGDFYHFEKMHREIAASVAHLTKENAHSEIDRALRIAFEKKKPVYLNLPIDVAEAKTIKPSHPLMVPSTTITLTAELTTLIKTIETQLQHSTSPIVIAGHEILSWHLEPLLNTFIQKFNLPITTLPFGKSAFNEEDPHYLGTYSGSTSDKILKERVDTADLVLLLGVKLSDSATSGFSYGFTEKQMISIGCDELSIFGTKQNGIPLNEFLPLLIEISYAGYKGDFLPTKHLSTKKQTKPLLTQIEFWATLETFFRQGDIIAAEQGTSFFGMTDVVLKNDMRFIGQPLWGSIGYTFPALLGSQIALPDRRHFLFIGDGSLQLSVQELGLAMREQLTPVIFVINNNGYTVEREIHGANELYNDIPMWDYQHLPAVFGGNEQIVATHKAKTIEDLLDILSIVDSEPTKMHWIEVILNQEDAPDLLKKLGKIFAKQNS